MLPTAHDLIAALSRSTELRTLRLFRPPRSALVLPLARTLLGNLEGRRVLEVGSGEPLLLAKAMSEAGAEVQAVDPALAAPRVEPGDIEIVADDALRIPEDDIVPADLSVSTLLFGAPLRQRAKRELRSRYLSQNPPTPAEVQEQLRSVERRLVKRLASWTRPGGWTLHISLERLFTLSADEWRELGFRPVLQASSLSKPKGDDPLDWAKYALSGAWIAQREDSQGGS